MKSQRPAALADMSNIMAVRNLADDARVSRVPPVQPQPILAPLTPAAIFLVLTIDDGGEATVHDALPNLSGLVRAIGFRDPTKHLSVVASIGSDAWDPVVRRPAPAELHPFIELKGPQHHAAGDPRRSVVSHSGRIVRRVLRVGRPHRQVNGQMRSPWSTRCTASSSSTTATCWVLSTAPETFWPSCDQRHRSW